MEAQLSAAGQIARGKMKAVFSADDRGKKNKRLFHDQEEVGYKLEIIHVGGGVFKVSSERCSLNGGMYPLSGETSIHTYEEMFGKKLYHNKFKPLSSIICMVDYDDASIERNIERGESRRFPPRHLSSTGWLEQCQQTYQRELPRLQTEHLGEFVAIDGRNVVEVGRLNYLESRWLGEGLSAVKIYYISPKEEEDALEEIHFSTYQPY